jgi:hypothetical protein
VAGQERAQAYSIYFQNYPINSSPVKLNYLFAAANSNASHRPVLTITPLSTATGLKINGPKWPGQVFGGVLQLCYDGIGNIVPAQTVCISQTLMSDDHGQKPPLPLAKRQGKKK